MTTKKSEAENHLIERGAVLVDDPNNSNVIGVIYKGKSNAFAWFDKRKDGRSTAVVLAEQWTRKIDAQA